MEHSSTTAHPGPTINVKQLLPWIVYVIFFAVLNETVFNGSIATIAHEFQLSPAGVSWMMTIFMVLFGIGSVIFGKLSDMFALRNLIIIGVVTYATGSVMGFLVQSSYPLVIVARAVQGIGASAIPPLIFIVIARYFPAGERGKVFGLITATVSLGIGLGPLAGGVVSSGLGWAYLFLIPILTLISVPFFLKALPKEPRRSGSIDLIGAILIALTVGSLVVFLNFIQWYYLVAFVVCLTAFIWRIRTAAEPFIEPALFKNVKFRSGTISGFVLFAVVIGVMFVIPFMLNNVYGLTPFEIGLVLFPGAISSMFIGPFSGKVASRRGDSFVVLIGLLLLAGSMVIMATFLTASIVVIAGAMLVTYAGFSAFQTALINSVSLTLPEHETGVGMGVFNLVGIIAGAVDAAVVGKVLEARWLNIPILPAMNDSTLLRTMFHPEIGPALPNSPNAFEFSNLLLILVPVSIIGGLVYLLSYRGGSKTPALVPEAAKENA